MNDARPASCMPDSDRMIRLEERIAWLELTVNTLDTAVTRQAGLITALELELANMQNSLENPPARNLEDRPPHW